MARAVYVVGFGFLWAVTAEIAWGQQVVTAGPDGDYATIQEAIEDALAWAEGEVRIQAGTLYEENLVITVPPHQYLSISGGWNSDFNVRSDDPTLTAVHGTLSGRVARVIVGDSSTFYLQNLTFVAGQVLGAGGGVYLTANNADEVGVYGNVFSGNVAWSNEDDAEGGGLWLRLVDTFAEVNDNRFFHNGVQVSAAPAMQGAYGGGVGVYLGGSAHLQFRGNRLDDCYCRGFQGTTGGNAGGCGVYVRATGSSTLDMAENVILNSKVVGFTSLIRGIAGFVVLSTTATIEMERNQWQGAAVADCPGLEPSFVHLLFEGAAQVVQRSSLIADSPSDGLVVERWFGVAGFSWRGVNLTVVGNGGNGVRINDDSGTATHWLSNSLVFGNQIAQVHLVGGPDLEQVSNLIGVDPGCVNPEGGFYQLASGSLALEAGDNNPTGGLTTLDLGGENRLQGGRVDIGAYEGTSLIWADGFETGETTLWSDQAS